MNRFLVTTLFVVSSVLSSRAQDDAPRNFFSILRPFKEAPLVSGLEAYRIIVSPDDSAPLLISVAVTPDGGEATAKRLKRRGYAYGGIAEANRFLITKSELSEIREVFRNAKLQELPIVGRPTAVEDGDGSVTICLHAPTWYIEQIVDGSYKRVEQYCPAERSLIEIGFVMLRISRFKIPKEQLFQ